MYYIYTVSIFLCHNIQFYAPINVKPEGEGRQGIGPGDLIVFVGPGVGALTNLVLPGEGIFESLFARRGTDVGMDLTADSDERG